MEAPASAYIVFRFRWWFNIESLPWQKQYCSHGSPHCHFEFVFWRQGISTLRCLKHFIAICRHDCVLSLNSLNVPPHRFISLISFSYDHFCVLLACQMLNRYFWKLWAADRRENFCICAWRDKQIVSQSVEKPLIRPVLCVPFDISSVHIALNQKALQLLQKSIRFSRYREKLDFHLRKFLKSRLRCSAGLSCLQQTIKFREIFKVGYYLVNAHFPQTISHVSK